MQQRCLVKFFVLFGLTIFLETQAVVVFPKTINYKTRKIKFEQVQALDYGKDTNQKLIEYWGKPDQVVRSGNGELEWIYRERLIETISVESAAFNIAEKSGLLNGAVWIPQDTDPLSKIVNLAAQFKGAHFIIKSEGQVSRDYDSDNLIYRDEDRGVSFLVSGQSKLISAIVWSIPKKRESTTKPSYNHPDTE